MTQVIRIVRRSIKRLRLQELNSLTVEARSRERNKRIGLSAVTSVAARGVGLVTALITVPLTLRYLGTEQFGLWVTITSATALLLGFANFGLSNGLVNAVSEAHGKDDRDLARRYVASAFYLLVGVAFVLGLAFVVAYPFVPWPRVFNVASSDAGSIAGPAMAVLVGLTLVGLPLSVVPSAQTGYQEGFSSSVWQGVGSVITLAALGVAVAAQASLPWLVVALGGGPLVATLINGFVLVRRRPWLIPRVSHATLSATRSMLRIGLLFFILGIAAAVAYQTDNLVIAQLLGANEVAQYAIPMRLYMMVPLLMSFALTPLWPAYGEALARGDQVWVKRTFIRSLAISSGLGLILTATLFVFGVPLLHAWAGPAINPSTSLLLALATWAFLNCLTGPIAMYLNGANVLGFQAVCATVMMVANLALSILLTRAIGISGPAWGSVVAQIVFVLLPCAVYLRSRFRRSAETQVGAV